MTEKRSSGILLHISSLPSPFSLGDLGPSAYKFIDFLADAGQRYWQILPLNPTKLSSDNSPYQSNSAFGFNTLLISPELLVESGLLKKNELKSAPKKTGTRAEYEAAIPYKDELFTKAYDRFRARKKTEEYDKFCEENAFWLEDYALFAVCKTHFEGAHWNRWPEAIKNREPTALFSLQAKLSAQIEREKYLQFTFMEQWAALRRYCQEKDIRIIGDIPIYVTYDSVDLWTHPELFKLDDNKMPVAVSGVPPDYFSETGQLWGNPVYDWDAHRKHRYKWWLQRLTHNILLFDIVRIDHFRGLVGYWEVAAGETTAINGKWVKVPAFDFFNFMKENIPHLPIIAEDLGTITNDVKEVMRHFNIPGMRVLLFAFGGDFPDNAYLPHNAVKDCVFYTGTHDNNTIRGWLHNEATAQEKKNLIRYLGRGVNEDELHWELIRIAEASVADVVIVPMQDLLGLDASARMNQPATPNDNWRWRVTAEQLKPSLAKKLRELSATYGRVPLNIKND